MGDGKLRTMVTAPTLHAQGSWKAGVELSLWVTLCLLLSGGYGEGWAMSDSLHLLSHSELPRSKRRAMEAKMWSEVLTLLSNLADLANAVHWLPAGVLWAGRFPPWLVGLLGTISSLLSMYQAARASSTAEADSS